MDSLLNKERPPVFCPGCSHDSITRALDKSLINMGLEGNQVAVVSDIGCSGLFDTFFNTHAFHGLHGRALTYAIGIKMARPDLKVIVTMGDGGLGIGGAHLLSACRKNIDLTLLILNNYNFGMTGGQYSSTTPAEAIVGSSFLNRLEKPIDATEVAKTAGAGYIARISTYQKDVQDEIRKAIEFNGFSVIDIHGICPGRYTKRNKLTPKSIELNLKNSKPAEGIVVENKRPEFGENYRRISKELKPVSILTNTEKQFSHTETGRKEVIILGNAGQRVITAGDILCLSGMTAGMNTTQKNEYHITVLRGPSISEIILSHQEVDYTGIENPSVIIAIGQDGVDKRKNIFETLDEKTLIIKAGNVKIPETGATIKEIDFKAYKVKPQDMAMASLSIMAKSENTISLAMLKTALKIKFRKDFFEKAEELVDRMEVKTEVRQ